MFHQLCHDESGVIIAAELVLVLTLTVLAMVVGLSEVAVAANTELNDISNALGAFSQSYFVTGFVALSGSKAKAGFTGTQWIDTVDDCDTNTTCDLVVGSTPGLVEGVTL